MVLAALLIVLHCIAVRMACVVAEDQCEYYYSEQPPGPLSCDPYQARELKMECTVHGPVGAEFEVAWFSSRSDMAPNSLLSRPADDAVLMRNRHNNSSIRSQTREDETGKTIRSRLQIQLLQDMSSTAFWCTVTQPVAADDGSVTLTPSRVFVLQTTETYQNLPSCGDMPQSFHGERCAAISLLQPATPPTETLTPTLTQSLHSTFIQATPSSSSSAWQRSPPTSQLPHPTMNAFTEPPPLKEGKAHMLTIVIPILAGVTGVITTLCLTSCLYLRCYCRKKRGKAVRKQVIEATYHDYSTPNSLSSSFQWKGAHQRPRLAVLSHSPSSSPTLPPSRRTRSLKLEDSQNISLWSDQYIDMGSGHQREASYSSWPTLNRNGHSSSVGDAEEGRLGSSYEVPIPSCLEPVYATIPSPSESYLIPMSGDVELRSHQTDSHDKRHCSPKDTTAQLCLPPPDTPSLHRHDYEEVIHTRPNTAYLETAVSSEQHTPVESPALPLSHNTTHDIRPLVTQPAVPDT